MIKKLTLIALIFLPLSIEAKVKEFKKPVINGYRLDRCLSHGTDCDGPAAMRFCLTKKFNKAIYWEIDKNIHSTRNLDSNGVCRKKCDAFKTIVCHS